MMLVFSRLNNNLLELSRLANSSNVPGARSYSTRLLFPIPGTILFPKQAKWVSIQKSYPAFCLDNTWPRRVIT